MENQVSMEKAEYKVTQELDCTNINWRKAISIKQCITSSEAISYQKEVCARMSKPKQVKKSHNTLQQRCIESSIRPDIPLTVHKNEDEFAKSKVFSNMKERQKKKNTTKKIDAQSVLPKREQKDLGFIKPSSLRKRKEPKILKLRSSIVAVKEPVLNPNFETIRSALRQNKTTSCIDAGENKENINLNSFFKSLGKEFSLLDKKHEEEIAELNREKCELNESKKSLLNELSRKNTRIKEFEKEKQKIKEQYDHKMEDYITKYISCKVKLVKQNKIMKSVKERYAKLQQECQENMVYTSSKPQSHNCTNTTPRAGQSLNPSFEDIPEKKHPKLLELKELKFLKLKNIAKIEALESQLEHISKDANKLSAKAMGLEESNLQLKNEVEYSKKQIEVLVQSKLDYSTKLDSLLSQQEILSSVYKTIEVENERLNAVHFKQEADLRKSQNEVSRLQSQVLCMNDSLKNLEEQRASEKTLLAASNTKEQLLRGEIVGLKNTLNDLCKEGLEQLVSKMNKELDG
eukprot:snap_masked-scaffold_20-processed-gene-5.100-mRNA-1 protein AED:1.00 eAED:1.00 QI:0/0/0/0/1/1/2/0/516